MELQYIQKGDYLFPNLVMMEPEGDIGKYGQLRLTFLREHRKGRYSGLLLTGKLWAHLLDTDERAAEEVERLISELAVQYGITELLKEQDQMEWVRRMNHLIAVAEEIVLAELVYC